jgi:hypothetical protein
MLCARAGASAIAAALALSPIHAAAPKPIVDLSKSPAETGKVETAPQPKGQMMIGPFDQQTAMEVGGGTLALLVLGTGALALSRRRKKREEVAAWNDEAIESGQRDPLFDEPMFHHEPAAMESQPAAAEPSAFAWGNQSAEQADSRREDESWVERARRGPSPENPSLSLRTRLKRAAFFDKREREAAAGKAAPLDTDAGLPEALIEEREDA